MGFRAFIMKKFQTIQYNVSGYVARVVLNRPEKRNAINALMASELIEALEAAGNDSNVDMLVLQGAGKSFCAGADLDWMRGTSASISEQGSNPGLVPGGESASESKTESESESERLSRYQGGSEIKPGDPSYLLPKLFKTTFYFPKPLIIRVHGTIMGGALGLMVAGDHVLAAADARFSFSEVRLGLVPATISPFVIRRIGEYNARQLMLGGDVIGAQEALQARLIDKVIPDGDLDNEINSICEKLSGNAPEAMKKCKQLLMHVAEHSIDDHIIKYTAQILDEVRHGDEAQEGMRAFREKRKAIWRRTSQS